MLRIGPALAAAVVSAVVLVACGDDDEDSTRTVTVTETTTQTVTVETAPSTETAPSADTDARSRGTVDCGNVGFEPNTDSGAFGIEATGVECELARRVAAAAEGAGLEYEAEGFSCTGVRQETALPTVRFICERGSDRLEFTAS